MASSTAVEQTAWSEISTAIAAAPYPVMVLPVDTQAAAACLARLGMTTSSWLGALVANTGGLLIDHGWLRALGSGHAHLADVVSAADNEHQRLIVGHDVLGGRFGWFPARPDAAATVHYFGPDTLHWQDLDLGYAAWLHAFLGGAAANFYDTLRWPGWQDETTPLQPDQGISAWPPPWSREGADIGAASRRPVPIAELLTLYADAGHQLRNE